MHAMQPLLAFNMDEAKAWSFLIVGTVAAIAAAVGSIVTAIQNYRNSQKLDVAHQQRAEAKLKAEKSEVKIDKTLKNTNGGMHKMVQEVSGLKEEVRSLKTQNTNLKHEATVKQQKAKPRPSPKTR